MNDTNVRTRPSVEGPSFKEALAFWFKLGWISFGGTAGHIAIMHDFLVEKKKWISGSRFFHALSFCMLLPGPEAQQLAIYIGWKLHGRRGGLVAGILFVLPSMLILLVLSILYTQFGNLSWMSALFAGLKPAVIAIILVALYKIGRKALQRPLHFVLAGTSFVCIFFYNISLPLILAGTVAVAVMLKYLRPSSLGSEKNGAEPEALNEREYYLNRYSAGEEKGISIKRLLGQLTIFLLFWAIPILCFYLFSNSFSFWRTLILFFTQAAFLTIGGSYTVLPYVAQFAVSKFNWLSRSQMVDGFALAETTPGPLIIVVGFAGFMAGYHYFHGSLRMGSIALVTTIFYTFLPCFLYIFSGGPVIERTHGNRFIESILKLVTASVVGVILNLSLFLGRDVIFPAGVSGGHADLYSLGWIVVSLLLLSIARLMVVLLIVLSLVFGMIRHILHLV